MREVMFSFSPTVSSRSRSSGNSGVRSSKRRRVLRLLGVEARDRVDAEQRGVLLVARRGPARALDRVALAEGEALRLADRDVDVLGRRQVALRADEAVALVAQVEEPADLDELAGVGLLLGALEVAVAALAVTPAAAPVVPSVGGVVGRRRPALAAVAPARRRLRAWDADGTRSRRGGRPADELGSALRE